MAVAQTAELLVLLKLQDQMSGAVAEANAKLGTLGKTALSSGTALEQTASKTALVGRATTSAGQALTHVGGVVGGVVRSVGLLGGSIALFAGPAAIGAAVKSSITFQQQMEMIRTQAGATQSEVDSMSKSLLTMGASTSYSANELALGLYHVESVGYRGAKALDVLAAAAQGARMGNADLEQTTTALVAAVYSGVKGTGDLSTAMGSLDAIVGAGNMRMQDLVQALGTGVLASARAVGLSLNDVGAAMAVLVDQGVPATVAATRLRTTLGLIAAPSHAAQDQLKSIGITGTQLADDMRKPQGLITTLQDLHDHLKKAGDISANGNLTTAGAALVYRSFGASRSGTTIVTLLDSMDKVSQKYGQISQNAADFSARVDATTQTAAYHFAQFQAAIANLGVSIGQVLLPFASQFAAGAATWLTDNQTGIVTALEAAGSAASLLGTALGAVLSVLTEISKIPMAGTALDLLAGGAVLGKVSSMLFGKNPFTFALGSVLGKLGIGGKGGGLAGSALGGAAGGPVPVYVVNMGASGMGGAAGTAEGAAAGAGGLSAAGVIASVGGGLAIAAIFKSVVQDPAFNKQSADIRHNALGEIKAPGTSQADLLKGLAATQTGLSQLNAGNPIMQALYGQQISDLQKTQQMYLDALAKLVAPTGTAGRAGENGQDKNLPTAKATLAAIKNDGINLAAIKSHQQALLAQQRVTADRIGNAVAASARAITGSQAQGFGGVIGQLGAVIAAIMSVGTFGGAVALGRGTAPGGRVSIGAAQRAASAPVGTEGNRGYVHISVQATSSARSNDAATLAQTRYGPTPSRAGSAVVLVGGR